MILVYSENLYMKLQILKSSENFIAFIEQIYFQCILTYERYAENQEYLIICKLKFLFPGEDTNLPLYRRKPVVIVLSYSKKCNLIIEGETKKKQRSLINT